MLDEKIKNLILETSTILKLRPAMIEKDYYVTKVISILSNIQDDHSALIFAGGTCLSKAHRLVNRMSEDVDFKFQKKVGHENLSKNAYLKTLKLFRDRIVSSLDKMTDIKKAVVVRNEGKYMRINLEYTSAFTPSLQLRPDLLVEFTLSSLHLPTKILPIATLIENTLGDDVNLETCKLPCISAEETAAEKWVGLTRRIAASNRGYFQEDVTLVRHIYDLAAINMAYSLNDNFFILVPHIILNDAKQFKNQHPEYFSNPSQEIEYSLAILKNNPEWAERYDDFISTMVYISDSKHTYEYTFSLLEKLSVKVLKNLQQMAA